MISTFIGTFLQPYNFDDDDTAITGAVCVLLGLVGAVLFGVYVDNTRRFKCV